MIATQELESVILSNLKPSTKYSVLIQAKTNAGIGPASDAQLCSTLDEGKLGNLKRYQTWLKEWIWLLLLLTIIWNHLLKSKNVFYKFKKLQQCHPVSLLPLLPQYGYKTLHVLQVCVVRLVKLGMRTGWIMTGFFLLCPKITHLQPLSLLLLPQSGETTQLSHQVLHVFHMEAIGWHAETLQKEIIFFQNLRSY